MVGELQLLVARPVLLMAMWASQGRDGHSDLPVMHRIKIKQGQQRHWDKIVKAATIQLHILNV